MLSTLVSGLGHCVQPTYQTLVAIEEVSKSRSGPQSAAVLGSCKSVYDLNTSYLHHSQILTASTTIFFPEIPQYGMT